MHIGGAIVVMFQACIDLMCLSLEYTSTDSNNVEFGIAVWTDSIDANEMCCSVLTSRLRCMSVIRSSLLSVYQPQNRLPLPVVRSTR